MACLIPCFHCNTPCFVLYYLILIAISISSCLRSKSRAVLFFDFCFNLRGDFRVVVEELFCLLTSLGNFGAFITKPTTAFLNHITFYTEINNFSRLRNSFAKTMSKVATLNGGASLFLLLSLWWDFPLRCHPCL